MPSGSCRPHASLNRNSISRIASSSALVMVNLSCLVSVHAPCDICSKVVQIRETKTVSMGRSRIFTNVIAAALLFGLAFPLQAKQFIKGERPQQRGYSQAVITEGGKIVWLAGQLAVVDDSGKSLAGDLDGQVRQIFKLINATLEKAGGKLGDMVQMTVFITDVRYGDRLTQLRREIFGDNFPGSALITVTALAIPEAKVEIQGYAVIGGK